MHRAVIIYDGECGLCEGSVGWIARRARPGDFEFLACQAPERRRRFPALEERACLEAMHLVLPDGRALRGADAVAKILERLPRWRWLARLLHVPGLARLAPPTYRWIARHRQRLSCALRAPRG